MPGSITGRAGDAIDRTHFEALFDAEADFGITCSVTASGCGVSGAGTFRCVGIGAGRRVGTGIASEVDRVVASVPKKAERLRGQGRERRRGRRRRSSATRWSGFTGGGSRNVDVRASGRRRPRHGHLRFGVVNLRRSRRRAAGLERDGERRRRIALASARAHADDEVVAARKLRGRRGDQGPKSSAVRVLRRFLRVLGRGFVHREVPPA